MSNRSVLIVDDEKDIREMLRMALTAGGYQVMTAEDGIVALNQIESNVPTAMVLDLMMPRMSGYEVVEVLRNAGMLDHLPVIILTARDLDMEDRERLDGTRAIFQKGSMDVMSLVHQFDRVLAA